MTYIGWTICLVGGIVQLTTALKATPIITTGIHLGLIRILLTIITIPIILGLTGFLTLKLLGVSLKEQILKFIQSMMKRRLEKQMDNKLWRKYNKQ